MPTKTMQAVQQVALSKHAGWRLQVRQQCGVKVHMEGRRSPNIAYNIPIIWYMEKNTALYCFSWHQMQEDPSFSTLQSLVNQTIH